MGIATDSLQTYFFRFGNLACNFIIGVITARLLGPAGKGSLVLAFLINNLYIYLFGNLGGAVTYRISRLKESPRPVLFTAAIYSLTVGLITIAGIWLYTRFNPPFFPDFIWVIILNAPFALLLPNFHGAFLGLNRIIAVNWYSFSPNFFWLLLIIPGFFFLKLGVSGVLICWFITQLLLLGWCFSATRQYWKPPYQGVFSKQLLLKMLGFGWQLGLVNLVTFLNYRIDMFLVARFLGAGRLGLYSVAVSGAEVLWFTSTAVATAIYARVGMVDPKQAGELTAKAVRHTLYINLALGFMIWLAAEFFLPLIYGDIYRPSLAPLRVLIPGVLAYGLVSVFAAYFTNQLGKPRIPLLISATAALINLGISWMFIPRVGMMGGAWATTISYIVSLILVAVIFCRNVKIGLKQLTCFTMSDWGDYRSLGQKMVNKFWYLVKARQ